MILHECDTTCRPTYMYILYYKHTPLIHHNVTVSSINPFCSNFADAKQIFKKSEQGWNGDGHRWIVIKSNSTHILYLSLNWEPMPNLHIARIK